MGKLFKNLKPYWKSVLMIVVLLVVQAFCDLSLPQYTSDIIDTGIQNSGVEHILPEKITAEEFQNAQLFMTADEQKTWQDAYSGDGDLLDRNDCSKKDLEQFDSDLIVPILLNYQMSMMSEDSFREMLAQQQQGNPQAAEQLKTMSTQVTVVLLPSSSSSVRSNGVRVTSMLFPMSAMDMVFSCSAACGLPCCC